MAFCEKCGSELSEGSAFCPKCGTSVRAEAAQAPAAPPPSPPSAAPPSPRPEADPRAAGVQPGYQPPQAPPAPGGYQPAGGKKGGGKAILFGGLGLLIVGIVVVLLLGFAVGPKWFTGGGGGEGGPEEVAANFLKAMEDKDAKLLKSTIAPSSIEYLESMLSYGDYGSIDEFFEDMFFSTYQSMKFTGVKYKTTMQGEDEATVEIVEGKVTMVDENGEETTEDVQDAETPAELPMVKVGGKWYLDMVNM